MAPRTRCSGYRRAHSVTTGHAPRTPTLRRKFVAANRGRLGRIFTRWCSDVRHSANSGPATSPLAGPRLLITFNLEH